MLGTIVKDTASVTTGKIGSVGGIGYAAEPRGEVTCDPSTEGCTISRNTVTETGVKVGSAVLDEIIPNHAKGCPYVLKGKDPDDVAVHRKIS